MRQHISICLLVLLVHWQVASSSVLPKLTIISVPNGGPWGDWRGIAVCPGNSKAVGFSIKVEWDQGGDDDTALNEIALACFDADTLTLTEIKSSEGSWGNWGGRVSCLGNGYLTSFSLKVQAPLLRSGDDTAANDINFRCSTGEILEGHGMMYGNWGAWSGECPSGICGIETKIEHDLRSGDDTALNDVRFLCC